MYRQKIITSANNCGTRFSSLVPFLPWDADPPEPVNCGRAKLSKRTSHQQPRRDKLYSIHYKKSYRVRSVSRRFPIIKYPPVSQLGPQQNNHPVYQPSVIALGATSRSLPTKLNATNIGVGQQYPGHDFKTPTNS